MNYKRTTGSVTFLFILSGLVMSKQLLSTAYFSCFISDSYQYASWAWQFLDALKEGILYPRWTPANFWGYGSPTFILYPPLVFYLVALFNFLTSSIVTSMDLTKFLSLFVSSVGVFCLIREMYSERVALLTASLNALLPFYTFNIYIGGAFTSSISVMWFPFIMLFVYRYTRTGEGIQLIYAGLCYGGLILTHLVNAYMFAFVIAAFLCSFAVSEKRLRYVAGMPVIFIVGILVSAAYLVPLIAEGRFISYRDVMLNFHFSDFFILPRTANEPHSDFFWEVYYKEYLFHLVLFFVVSLLILLRMKSNHFKTLGESARTTNKVFLGISFASMFLLFGPSSFLWNSIPLFKYIDIPARWLNTTAFAVVFLSAAGFSLIDTISRPALKRYVVLAIIFLSCASIDYKYVASACAMSEGNILAVRDINWLPEHLPQGVHIASIDESGNPIKRASIIKGEGKAEVVSWKSAERAIRVMADGPVTLRVRTFNFPGWIASVNNRETGIQTEEGSGAMLIEIPGGRHTLNLRFVDTGVRHYSKIVSLISLFSIAAVTLLALRGRKEKRIGKG